VEEFRCFGPPGTGKTTRLATRDIPRAVAKFGPAGVMVASFTKTAAWEIANKPSRETGQTIPVDRENVGTLHAICYRALGYPDLYVKAVSEWNRQFPQFQMSGEARGDVSNSFDEKFAGGEGDKMLNLYSIARAKMVEHKHYHPALLSFSRKWETFKDAQGVRDFTDLISDCYNEIPFAPGNPDCLLLDEAQDFTQLELSLARRWALNMRWLILVGDDDQTIYQFTGADPRAFLNPPVADDRKTVLKQSYRVPRRILAVAQKIIKKVSIREPKEYAARDAEGAVYRKDGTYTTADLVVDEAASHSFGETCMFLASCSYMIEPIKAQLKEKAIPFANPYRKTRGDWNPLTTGGVDKITATDLVKSFLETGEDGYYWSVFDLIRWARFIKVGPQGLIRKKGKKAIKALDAAVEQRFEGLETSRNVLSDILSPEAIKPALDRDLDWLTQNLQTQRQASTKFPIKIARRNPKALDQPPTVIIGTIHSVKGGEADHVYLFPDISFKAQVDAMENRSVRDAIYRLFYVGMTRARQTLTIMEPYQDRYGRNGPYVEL
jgi:DNA helicase-2/ATP-dependent DNA helicase PcrA